jgi:hypothetical protein
VFLSLKIRFEVKYATRDQNKTFHNRLECLSLTRFFKPFTRVGSDLAPKRLSWLERLARDKHSSLLRAIIN